MIDMNRVSEFLSYDPVSGEFRWTRRKGAGHAGSLAGEVVKSTGYRRLNFDGQRVFAHRLAYAMMTGEWPETVDHINHIRTDNRWSNLRAASFSQQQGNRRKIGGKRGVYEVRGGPQWRARLWADGKLTSIGTFPSREAAQAAYDAAAKNRFGEFYSP